jgi:hypothetical protein
VSGAARAGSWRHPTLLLARTNCSMLGRQAAAESGLVGHRGVAAGRTPRLLAVQRRQRPRIARRARAAIRRPARVVGRRARAGVASVALVVGSNRVTFRAVAAAVGTKQPPHLCCWTPQHQLRL